MAIFTVVLVSGVAAAPLRLLTMVLLIAASTSATTVWVNSFRSNNIEISTRCFSVHGKAVMIMSVATRSKQIEDFSSMTSLEQPCMTVSKLIGATPLLPEVPTRVLGPDEGLMRHLCLASVMTHTLLLSLVLALPRRLLVSEYCLLLV